MGIENFPFKKPENFIEVGSKKLRPGDNVIVHRTSGDVENDWVLKSFGKKYAVVEKYDPEEGAVLRKVVPLNEFIEWQKEAEEPYGGLEEGFGGEKYREYPRIDSGTPEGREKLRERLENFAKALDIDTSKENWEKELEKRIREITGT